MLIKKKKKKKQNEKPKRYGTLPIDKASIECLTLLKLIPPLPLLLSTLLALRCKLRLLSCLNHRYASTNKVAKRHKTKSITSLRKGSKL